MAPVGFEPTISAGERPQTYALDRAATGTGKSDISKNYKFSVIKSQLIESNNRNLIENFRTIFSTVA